MSAEDLYAHLATGCTTVCHLWHVVRPDGTVLGFTDHDQNLTLDGVEFRADSGLTAKALQQTTGLSVDNTEAVGALSSLAIDESDIRAGRFDQAEVTTWMVNWNDLRERVCLFKGHFGELTYSDGVFKVELRGLADRLNQLVGRTFQRTCGAVLGDAKCKVDLTDPQYSLQATVIDVSGQDVEIETSVNFAEGWFARGTAVVTSGVAAGLQIVIKTDQADGSRRRFSLWEDVPEGLVVGDSITLKAGCDRMLATCRTKFDNLLNFRGFPHIPGDDWISSYPVSNTPNTGQSLVRGQTP